MTYSAWYACAMSDDFMIQIWINPLSFPKLDGVPPAIPARDDATAEEVLEFLAGTEVANDIPAMVKRYREITAAAPRLFAVPAEPRILEKLVWPLRQAKASYVVGNYLATIALCGMVSEMVAILLFETANIQMNNVPLREDDQTALYGSHLREARARSLARGSSVATEASPRSRRRRARRAREASVRSTCTSGPRATTPCPKTLSRRSRRPRRWSLPWSGLAPDQEGSSSSRR